MTIDADGHRITSVYDSYGRASVTINGLGNRTTTLYDSYGRARSQSIPLAIAPPRSTTATAVLP